jgi:alkylation response protein AidB-like acyl-CoA dehydrogenase
MTIALAPDLHALSDEMLDRFGTRPSGGEHRSSDFEELSRAGYLLLAVPVEFGGLGGNLVQACHQQRRLARRSPATARASAMHIVWTGVAAELYRGGDTSLNWLLEEAAAGEIFTGGPGNEYPNAAVAYLTWRQCSVASVSLGVADRALELAVAEAKRETPTGRGDGAVQIVAEMVVELEGVSSLAEHVAHDWTAGMDHGHRWMVKLAAVERWATEGARRVVDLALEVSGSASWPEVDRLHHDLGAIDPPDSLDVYELVGKTALGF